MKNKYGVTLDRNGYAPSIWIQEDRCAICGRRDRKLDRHEVYHASNRTKSKNLGLWVKICDLCHAELHQRNAKLDEDLKIRMQEAAMEHYGWGIDDFRKEIGKSYI